MNKNLGNIDRIIRILAAATIIFLFLAGIISGIWAIVLLVLAAVFFVTSFISFCPIYWAFGLNSLRKKTSK